MLGTIIERMLDRGFHVCAYKRSHGCSLSIQKEAKGQLLSRGWMIDQIELEQAQPSVLFVQADHYMDEIDSAIEALKEKQ